MRPKFLDQPYRWTRTKRTDESDIDAACAISHQPSSRSWIASDYVIAAIFVGVLLALLFGVL